MYKDKVEKGFFLEDSKKFIDAVSSQFMYNGLVSCLRGCDIDIMYSTNSLRFTYLSSSPHGLAWGTTKA